MKIVDLSLENSELNRFVAEMRDVEIQKDRMRFRRNIERVGEIMSYEVSKTFNYCQKEIITPLGSSVVNISDEQIVLGTMLRAGIPYHQGFLNYFDNAENAFISAYRKYKDALKCDINIEYIASPDINGKTLILADPMLATGSSMELTYRALLTKGKPKKVHMVSVIASLPALDYLSSVFADDDITVWTAAVDSMINEHAYIIPGLGDAGDLAYGKKL